MKLSRSLQLLLFTALPLFASDRKKELPELTEDTTLYPVDLGPDEPAAVRVPSEISCSDRFFRSTRTDLPRVLNPCVAAFESIGLFAAIASLSMILAFRYFHTEMCNDNFYSGSFILIGLFIAGLMEGTSSFITFAQPYTERRPLFKPIEHHPTNGSRNVMCRVIDALSFLGSMSGTTRYVMAMILLSHGDANPPCLWAERDGFENGMFIAGFALPALLQLVSVFFILSMGAVLDLGR